MKNLKSIHILLEYYYFPKNEWYVLANKLKDFPKIEKITINMSLNNIELKYQIIDILESNTNIKEINIYTF